MIAYWVQSSLTYDDEEEEEEMPAFSLSSKTRHARSVGYFGKVSMFFSKLFI